ncbi:MAG TPA: TetR/AcrR family transcriptional regulator [Ktedonobacteraceae bacterium]|nr:TetR/AcrR family transcriptional regulator [Ktedonobacteraceae bacterium]
MSDGAHVRRERDAEVARQAILDAAEQVFAENGFDGARIDAIAAASGYNKSLIFHYFGDKLGLYREIVTNARKHFERWFGGMLMPLVNNDVMPLDAGTVRVFLETFVKWYFNMVVEQPRMIRMVAWEAAEGWHTYTWSQRKPGEIEMNKSIIDFIRRAQQAGFIDAELDPLLLIFNIVGLCMFYVTSLPLLDQLKDITEEPVPGLAQAQDQIVKLVLRSALVPQKEADHETHI